MSLREPVPAKRITEAMLNGIRDKVYPQQVYVLLLKDLQTAGIAGAKASGWRFMGDLAGRDVSVDVECGRAARPAATEFSHGRHTTSARNAIRKIVKSSEVKKHHYELRLLAIPALGVEAVWLKAGSNTQDLVVPYSPRRGCG